MEALLEPLPYGWWAKVSDYCLANCNFMYVISSKSVISGYPTYAAPEAKVSSPKIWMCPALGWWWWKCVFKSFLRPDLICKRPRSIISSGLPSLIAPQWTATGWGGAAWQQWSTLMWTATGYSQSGLLDIRRFADNRRPLSPLPTLSCPPPHLSSPPSFFSPPSQQLAVSIVAAASSVLLLLLPAPWTPSSLDCRICWWCTCLAMLPSPTAVAGSPFLLASGSASLSWYSLLPPSVASAPSITQHAQRPSHSTGHLLRGRGWRGAL